MRTHLLTHAFWQNNLLSLHEVDVFIHTWDTVGPRSFGKYSTEHAPRPREDFDSGILSSPNINVDEVVNTWKPLQFVVESYENLHATFEQQIIGVLNERDRRGIPAGFEHHHPLSVRSMLYKRFKCNKLKCAEEIKMGKKYDLVIQTRPDIAVVNPFVSDTLDGSDILHFHNCRSVTPDPEINDFGCISSSEAMDVWCNLYNKIDGLFDILRHDDNYFKFLNPHKMYVQYLMNEKQTYKEIDLRLSIVRDTGIVLGWERDKNVITETLFK
jgi:hypothetical protein